MGKSRDLSHEELMMQKLRALLSVWDKQNIDWFARDLSRELGFELVSTGGTRKALEAAGLEVTDVADYTHFPEMMGGRLKTLHPLVHGGLLGRPDQVPGEAEVMKEHGIQQFQLVVVNLYPFVETIAKPGITYSEAVEQIDIGGPTMVRSMAKNFMCGYVVTHPNQYDEVLRKLQSDMAIIDPLYAKRLAAAAFEMTGQYDLAIAAYQRKCLESDG